MTVKYDHKGGLVEIGNALTVERDGIVHAIFSPCTNWNQLLTRCGKRGTGELGSGVVDCEGCLGL
jgi:hypothetical protein